jgi:hypothetical protein
MTSFCFAMSQDVMDNLSFCAQIENESRWEESTEFLRGLVNDERIVPMDKMHYLHRLKIIYQVTHDVLSYIDVSKKITQLCETNPDCNQERLSYYGSH